MAWVQGRDAPAYACQAAPGIRAGVGSFWRAASISKIVVGQVARAVLGEHLDADISGLLGWTLRNPACPDRPILLRHVVGHSAGFDDAGGYLVPAGVRLADWVAARGPALFLPHPPGQFMSYSNLGYILLAAMAERVGGASFDHLAERHVLGPWQVEAGFNWAGLGSGPRARALPTYRRGADGLIPQIDARVAARGISGPDGAEVVRSGVPGEDIGLLSPQGGLRLSLEGALGIARALRDVDGTPLWTQAMGPGDYLGGLMQNYGWGVQILPDPPFYPRPLVGHFANAYGFAGGVWYDRAADIAFVIALNGLEMGDEADALRPAERALFAEAAKLAGDGA